MTFGMVFVALWGPTAAFGAESTIAVAGLEQPAEIRIDRVGIPHIYAATHYDAFFVQGFNAARDRLWQIDLWRRRGLGKLSEVFGPGHRAQDRAARLFLYRGDLHREWLAYGADAKRVTERFVEGVNAYIALTEAEPERLPPEFGLMGYRPERWRPEDVVRIRSHGLWRNVDKEVARARLLCRFGADEDALRARLQPSWTPVIPDGIDLCAVPEGVLDDYLLARAPVTFAGRAAALAASRQQIDAIGIGSNNWAIAPSRTATGRPLLANDPHRAHAVPSLRYAAHLSAPGLDVIGAGEPALPGISIGHNRRIAFGLTIFALDQEDLYRYELSADGASYRYRDGFLPFESVEEVIAAKNAPTETATLRFTRHGPVVYYDAASRQAWAVRAAWLEPGMAPYFGSVDYMRADNWREFVSALNRWGAPGENQVYADVDGNIGYKAAGLFPRRINWDGLLPVPGDGRYEWQSFFDMDALPVEFNPARGFVATANAMTLPADFPIDERRVGFEWTPPWRQLRIDEVLSSQPRHTLADSLALQRDYTSVLARRLVAVLDGVEGGPAADMLRRWDGQLEPNSGAAALFMVWYQRHLAPALLAQTAPADALPLIGTLDSLAAIDLLARPSPERDALLERTLSSAWAETRGLLGEDPSGWRWGALHAMRFKHPLLSLAGGALADAMAMREYPRGGSGDTPNATSYVGSDFEVRSGASWRMVVDVGNWDAARMTNAPGQSGDPRSPFYDDLLDGWAKDRSFPLLYSHDAVRKATVDIIRLEPAASTALDQ